MNHTILIFLLMSILFLPYARAGNNASNKVIVNLLQDTKQVSFISWPKENYISNCEGSFKAFPQNLIKCGSALYVFINGSGKLYKVSENGNKEAVFTRVDSTTNFGYNIGSFGFSYNNKIYNLGGYGYWRMNGQLRVFNEKASQWDIVKLNKEIPLLTGKTEGMIWYDVPGKKIYTAYYLLRDEAIKTKELDETKLISDVMVLDLERDEWVHLGTLNNFLKNKLHIFKPITMSPWGQLITIGDKISLLDFINNQILTLDTHKEQYQSIIRSLGDRSYYFKDSTLYYGSNNNLDSIVMHFTDFITTNEPIYSKVDVSSYTNNTSSYLFIGVPLILIGTFIMVFRKHNFMLVKSVKDEFKLTNTTNKTKIVFTEMEVQLLQLLIHNTTAGTTTSTNEQNKVLGLEKKSLEVQKKQRSDIIIGINRKYCSVTKTEEIIIQKTRSEFDKRSYEYYIHPEKLEEIKRFLIINNSSGFSTVTISQKATLLL